MALVRSFHWRWRRLTVGIALRLGARGRRRFWLASISMVGFALFLRDSLVLPQTAESLEYLASWVLVAADAAVRLALAVARPAPA